jgi:hypothetical protein
MCMLKSMSLINLAKFLVIVVVGDGGQKVGGWKGRKGKPFFSLVQSELRLAGLLQCSGGPPCLIYRGFAVVVAKIRRVLFLFLSNSHARIRFLDLDHHHHTTPKSPPQSSQRPRRPHLLLHCRSRALPASCFAMVSTPAPSIHQPCPYPLLPLYSLFSS